MAKSKQPKGQTIKETLAVLGELAKYNLVFTHYKMVAYAEDGSKLQIGYDVKQDARFNKGQKPEG